MAAELRNAMKEHEVASGEVLRRERLPKSPAARPEDSLALTLVQAVQQEWRTLLDQMRERGRELIRMPAERRTLAAKPTLVHGSRSRSDQRNRTPD